MIIDLPLRIKHAHNFTNNIFGQLGDHDHVWDTEMNPNVRTLKNITDLGQTGWSHEETPTLLATRQRDRDLYPTLFWAIDSIFNGE
ncbi:MAG: hypothetical protein ACYTG0_16930 [Planctomycetota bacterium]